MLYVPSVGERSHYSSVNFQICREMAGIPSARLQCSSMIPQEMEKPVSFDCSGAHTCALRLLIRIFPDRWPLQVRCCYEICKSCDGNTINVDLAVPLVTDRHVTKNLKLFQTETGDTTVKCEYKVLSQVMVSTQCGVTCVFLPNIETSYMVKGEHSVGHILSSYISPTNFLSLEICPPVGGWVEECGSVRYGQQKIKYACYENCCSVYEYRYSSV